VELNAIRRSVSRRVLTAKKQSPHIFFAGGMIGMAASTFLACRATLKLSETLDGINKDINDCKNLKEEPMNYQTDQYNRDLFYVHVRAAVKITKLYAPSVGLGVVSIVALSGSHVQLTKRNASLMAAYATVQAAFNEYRGRIREEFGDERERDIYHGAKSEEITEDDGKPRTVKTIDPSKRSMYTRIFDEYSEKWQKDPELNRIYLECQQQYANDMLKVRGHVLLNDVYDMLGMDRSSAGAVVGWVIGEEGDNYIDFGMYEAYNTPFINGWERSVVLDFNVDGVIYDKI
jgi:hypothetical protein